MALPSTPEMWALVGKMIAEHCRDQNDTIRELLGRWVSELEPTIIYRDFSIVGIGVAGDPTGAVVINNPKCPPPRFCFTL